ncbi:BTB/POZ domain-containing protein At5g03250-like [Oryza glaberrima]|uniref:NPH3 domain-containing protein n=1 Tax=Oryza glaberrima TaxID=4538 RepID=I1PPP6_ORYGL|nr:BTB/POZ domain-containing protein At5g03250-like [Oryza glaberrima]
MAITKVLGSKPADCFQFQDPNSWTCMTELVSDVVVEVGDFSFHLHKFPLMSRSGTLQKLISEAAAGADDGEPCSVELHDVPGGAAAFELAARFCYDVRAELDAGNVVALRCAAEHLGMTEDHGGEGNLVEQAEAFLRDVLGSWDDALRALRSCDGALLPLAEELLVVPRCIDALASKACADPTLFGWPMVEYYTARGLEETVMWNGIATAGKPRSPGPDWWYKQASSLKLPVYKRLITAMRSKGMSPENIAGSLTHYAKRHLSGLTRHSGYVGGGGASGTVLSDVEQRALLEEIVALLPVERGVATTRFLLGLLRTATILNAGAACRDALERMAGNQLEEAALEDLLIPNTGYAVETLYDVDCVQRMLEQFVAANTSAFAASPEITDEAQLVDGPSGELMPISTVAKLVDGYLAEVATDTNVKLSKFQSIAELVPDYARAIDDGIYRAIDIYLKAHSWLTASEREQLCRLMNCQKLSLEACTHAAQNERLPLRVVVQVLFFEQLRLRTTVAGWFFVADNVDQGSPIAAGRYAPERSGELDFGAGPPEEEDGDDDDDEARNNVRSSSSATMSVDDIRQRVVELEEECSSMREEIHRIGKPKGALNRLFRKLGLGGRSAARRQQQQSPPPPTSSGDERRKSMSLEC